MALFRNDSVRMRAKGALEILHPFVSSPSLRQRSRREEKGRKKNRDRRVSRRCSAAILACVSLAALPSSLFPFSLLPFCRTRDQDSGRCGQESSVGRRPRPCPVQHRACVFVKRFNKIYISPVKLSLFLIEIIQPQK